MAEQLRARIAFEHGPLNTAYGALLGQLPSLPNNSQVFVASFSEEGDLLSQWLAYSGPSNGFALGFVPDQFEQARAEGFTLVRCVYDRAKQIELVSAAIDAICQSELDLDDEGIKKILITAASLKHPGFVREAEWRLIKPLTFTSRERQYVQFREGRFGLVPYINAPVVAPSEQLIPATIQIGPGADPFATKSAINTLLYAHGFKKFFGHSKVEVVLSQTPYRP